MGGTFHSGPQFVNPLKQGNLTWPGKLRHFEESILITYTGDFLDEKFHGSGTLVNDSFFSTPTAADETVFSRELHRPGGRSVRVGLVYEGSFKHGKKHGLGTWTLRPSSPTHATDNGLPFTVYHGEWNEDFMHGQGKFSCLPLYRRRPDEDLARHLRETPRFGAFGAMGRRRDLYEGPKSEARVKWHNFKDAIVEGGVFEGKFVRGGPEGLGTCTLYGSEYGYMDYWYSSAKKKDMPETQLHIKSFEGEITWHKRYRFSGVTCVITDISWVYWGHGCPMADARAPESDWMSVHFCIRNNLLVESGQCIRTLVNGDRWEGKLGKCDISRPYRRVEGIAKGTWTCTDKDGSLKCKRER